MSSFRQQTLIEAPLNEVWELVGDPRRYPEWAGDVVEVTGLAEVAEGAQFEQTTKTPLGKATTPYLVEALDDLHEIRLRCLRSGHYSHWVLTEAGDDTFCEIEVGMEPAMLRYRAVDATVGRRWYRNMVTGWVERIRAVATR